MRDTSSCGGSNRSAQGEVDRIVSHFQSLGLRYDFEPPAEHRYTSATLIVCDAVLSIHRKYKEFVLPRIDILRQKNLDQKSLSELVKLIETKGDMAFTRVWDYEYLDRVKTLKNLASRFLEMKQTSSISGDLEALHEWGRTTAVEDFDRFTVPGIGLATFQYLRILCGSETVKPDIHLRQAVADGLNRKISDDRKVIALLEAAARKMGVPAKRLDYAIWDRYSTNSRNSAKCSRTS